MHLSKKSEPPLYLEIKPSRLLVLFSIGVHLLAVISCLAMTVPLWLQISLLCALLLHFLLTINRQYLFSLQYTPAYGWQYALDNDNFMAMTILPSSVLTTWLIILHIKTAAGKHENLLVFKDSVSADLYRRLKVKLKVTAS